MEISVADVKWVRSTSVLPPRLDAVLFTKDAAFTPPNKLTALNKFRRAKLRLPDEPEDGGELDLVRAEPRITLMTRQRVNNVTTRNSRNITNLFMAGRDISVTHEALGAVRVRRTCRMMGEIIDKAAWIAVRHETSPRGVS